MKTMIKAVAGAILMTVATAQAAPLYNNSGFAPSAKVITFSEVALGGGTAVTTQFAGVTFGTNGPGNFYVGDGGYADANPVSGAYLDSFSGGTYSSVYDIDVQIMFRLAGAFWEFNAPSTATFTALKNGVALESFIYSNSNCCSSAEFVGFQGLSFDTLRVSNITRTHFYMDKLTYADVPEPGSIALFGLAGVGAAFARRRKAASKAA